MICALEHHICRHLRARAPYFSMICALEHHIDGLSCALEHHVYLWITKSCALEHHIFDYWVTEMWGGSSAFLTQALAFFTSWMKFTEGHNV